MQAHAVRDELTRVMHDFNRGPSKEEKERIVKRARAHFREMEIDKNIYNMSRPALVDFQAEVTEEERNSEGDLRVRTHNCKQLINKIKRALETGEFPPNIHQFMRECAISRLSFLTWNYIVHSIQELHQDIEQLRENRKNSPPGGDDTNPFVEPEHHHHPPVVHEIDDD